MPCSGGVPWLGFIWGTLILSFASASSAFFFSVCCSFFGWCGGCSFLFGGGGWVDGGLVCFSLFSVFCILFPLSVSSVL